MTEMRPRLLAWTSAARTSASCSFVGGFFTRGASGPAASAWGPGPSSVSIRAPAAAGAASSSKAVRREA